MEAVSTKSFETGAWKHVPFKNEAEGVIVTVIAQTGLVKHVIRMAPPQLFVSAISELPPKANGSDVSVLSYSIKCRVGLST